MYQLQNDTCIQVLINPNIVVLPLPKETQFSLPSNYSVVHTINKLNIIIATLSAKVQKVDFDSTSLWCTNVPCATGTIGIIAGVVGAPYFHVCHFLKRSST